MRYARLLALGVALGAFLLAPAGPARGSAFSVDTKSDAVDADPGDGLCAAADGLCSLRAAIQETNALPGPDAIDLPAGVYQLAIPGADEDAAATGDLDITDDLTITGAGRDATVIDGGATDRVFYTRLFFHWALTVEMTGLTVRNGRTAFIEDSGDFNGGTGGGIYNGDGVTMALTDVRVSGNTAIGELGGGIYNGQSFEDPEFPVTSLTMTRVSVTGNTAGAFDAAGDFDPDCIGLCGGHGGGIANAGRASLMDSEVDGNRAWGVGGISNGGGLAITNSSVRDNRAGAIAGGIWTTGSSVLTLADSSVTGNTVSSGAGGISGAGVMTIVDSAISGNSATFGEGGGIAWVGVTATVTGSTISGNWAAFEGGGVYSWTAGALALTNSTISGNRAGILADEVPDRVQGGGIFVVFGTLALTNVTISDNAAPVGGAIYNSPFNEGVGSVQLRNTIVASGTAGDNCVGGITSLGHNLEDADTCGFTGPGDLANGDPVLGPLQDNGGPTLTHALLPGFEQGDALFFGSFAIDAGDDSACPETDQRGFARPVDGNGDGVAVCDIGAYEAPEGTPTPPTPTPAPTPSATPTAAPAALPRSGGAPPATDGGSDVAAVAMAGALGMAAARPQASWRIEGVTRPSSISR